jgi:DNA-binding transcriptional ArsR family regulator
MNRVVRINGSPHHTSQEPPIEKPHAASAPAAEPRQEALEEYHLNRSTDPFDLELRKLANQTAEICRLVHHLVDEVKKRSSAAPDDGEVNAFWTQHPENQHESGSARMNRLGRPVPPDPRLIRRILRQRQQRAHFFGGDLFADPAWEMLLDLAAARAEDKRVSVTSLCIASGVPPTTALRWITMLTEAGLVERTEDDVDRRRAFIALSPRGADVMARYFIEIGKGASYLV